MITDRSKMQEGLIDKEIHKHVQRSNQTFLYTNYNNIYFESLEKELNIEHKSI